MGLDPLRDVIRGGYERGRAQYGELRLRPETYAHAVLARVDARMRAEGREPTGRAWSQAVERTELADLYLAIACGEHGDTAWRVLNDRFRKPLETLATHNGVAPADARAWVRDALADLGVEGRAGRKGSRLTAYDGSCSLAGWLMFAALRRARALVDGDDETLDDPHIVAAAEGRLSPDEAAAVQAEVANTGEIRVLLEDFSRELHRGHEPTAPPAEPAPQKAPPKHVRVASIAVLALAVLGTILWALLAPKSVEEPVGATEERLVIAGEALAARGGDAFRGFHPVTRAERASAGKEPAPAGFAVRRPRGISLDGRPPVSWTAVPGARQYTVKMIDSAGEAIWHRVAEGTALDYPSEAAALPGSGAGREITCEVMADTPRGRDVARASFRVASPDERASARALLAEAGRLRDEVVALLLQAHVAIRHEWWDEAERLTKAAAALHADDPVVRETLAYVQAGNPAGR